MWTSASAAAARTIMCDSWPSSGWSVTEPSGQLEAGALEVVAARPPAHGRAQHSVREAGRRARGVLAARGSRAGRTAPCRRTTRPGCREARRRECRPGPRTTTASPAASRRPRTPPLRRAPAIVPLTRSCGPTDTPPDVTSTSASSPRAKACAMRCLVVGDALVRLDDCARTGEERREHHAVRLVDLALPELLAGRPELGARRDDRRRAAAARTSARRPPPRRAPRAATA